MSRCSRSSTPTSEGGHPTDGRSNEMDDEVSQGLEIAGIIVGDGDEDEIAGVILDQRDGGRGNG